jgi:hypothetical protein
MSTELAAPGVDAETVARVLLRGDLKQLSAAQKVSYYRAVCESVGLNPLTQPFDYLVLNGREILYAKREATEQLRRLHQVSITIQSRELVGETYIVSARASTPEGRTDESIGVKSIDGLKGEVRANAMMTAETKAKRRVTLSICGLGMLDETEVADIPPAAKSSEGVAGKWVQTEYSETITPAPPDPTLPEGYVRVEAVESTPTKNPNVLKFAITLSSGEVVTTINNWLASIAEDAREKRTPVKAETKTTKWGTDLVSLKAAADPERQPELPPLTADDIPF